MGGGITWRATLGIGLIESIIARKNVHDVMICISVRRFWCRVSVVRFVCPLEIPVSSVISKALSTENWLQAFEIESVSR